MNANKCDFDNLSKRKAPAILNKCKTNIELKSSYLFVKQQLPQVAEFEIVKSLNNKNKNTLVYYSKGSEILGVYAFLMLSASGLKRLYSGKLQLSQPSLSDICRTDDKPSAIYKWAVVSPKNGSVLFILASKFLSDPLFYDVDIYTRPVTQSGLNSAIKLGFKDIPSGFSGLLKYRRQQNRLSYLNNEAA